MVHRMMGQAFLHNPDPGVLTTIDHIDRNPLNNDLCNLRWASLSLQMHNRDKRPNCLSRYHGVSMCGKDPRKPWSAAIYLRYKCHFLGRFATEALATAAHNEAAIRLYGACARLNHLVTL
jgi:hypothetical protein